MTESEPAERSSPSLDQAVVVAGGTGHHCVEATIAFAAGDRILHLGGRVVAEPTRYTVQIGAERHLESPAPPASVLGPGPHAWRFLNHACRPNARLRGRWLVATTAIAAGCEVTFDYTTTEYDMANPFLCACGAPECLGLVRGFVALSPAQREARRPLLALHLQRRLPARVRTPQA